jgi:hypothetical protein
MVLVPRAEARVGYVGRALRIITGIFWAVSGGHVMAIELMVRRLDDSLVPADAINREVFETLTVNQLYKAVLMTPRGVVTESLRRVAQNRLMWMWYTDLENTGQVEIAGVTKDEWHEFMKKEFLVAIYERDNQDFAEMMESLRAVYRSGLTDETDNLFKHIVRETSTTKATVKQFSEYLNAIERWCHVRGVVLTTDPEIYSRAFGKN